MALVSLASNAKVQKDLRTCPRRSRFDFVLGFFLFCFSFFFFFLILFSAVVVLAKNTQNVHGTSGGDAVIDAPFMSISR